MKRLRIRLTKRTIAWTAGVVVLVLGFRLSEWVWTWVSLAKSWDWYKQQTNRDAVVPIATFAGAATVAWAALRQANTASRQAKTSRWLHEEQTQANRQWRITEGFGRAAEQLGSDKLVVRLGGIYMMERISQESRPDYWTVMETLTAFVREKTYPKEPEENVSETVARFYQTPRSSNNEIPTDIAAALSVICRRVKANRERELTMRWRIDLQGADLRGAHLNGAYLCAADFSKANLGEAELVGADLGEGRLIKVNLRGANLRGANLRGANLREANLREANLREANLMEALLVNADLRGLNLAGADLRLAILDESQLPNSLGDERTILPEGMARPSGWPPAREDTLGSG